MTDRVVSLTSGRTLAKSAVWNLIGMAAPMLVGIVAIPLLISGMGEERFGLLAIIWMGVGYFSLFDLGLGRALTKLVAERLGAGSVEDLGPLIWTAIALMCFFSMIGGLVVFMVASPLVRHVFNVEPGFYSEAIVSFRILALGLPFVIITAALIGLLQAHQQFASITAVRIPLGVLTFAGPLTTLQFTPSLAWATGALVASRAAAMIAYFAIASRVQSEVRRPLRPARMHMRPLLHFGGWLTVSNIVGPIMTYLDRVFVGALLTMTAVTYYATPYEVLSRLQILPRSIMGVLFPAMSTAASGDRDRLVELYGNSSQLLVLLMLPVTGSLFLLAPEALDVWLGEEFRNAATPVVQWLAVGWMINTLARPAFTVLQSVGRPDLVAKAHLAELTPYILTVWVLTNALGIVGTAIAWTLRSFVDTALLNELARWNLPELHQAVAHTRITGVLILCGFGIAWLIESPLVRLLIILILTAVSGAMLCRFIGRLKGRRSTPGGGRAASECLIGEGCIER